jgi:hypothetical protein
MRTFSQQNQPVVANDGPDPSAIARTPGPTDRPLPAPPSPVAERPRRPHTLVGLLLSLMASFFWVGIGAAFLSGYLGPDRLLALPLPQVAPIAAALLLPPLLFIAIGLLIARTMALSDTAEHLLAASDRLLAVDDVAARSAARLGKAVRRELDGLNAGLDGAFQRLRALETVLENQIAALDEAGARAEVRGESISARLGTERERLEQLSGALTDSAVRASETVAGRAAQIKSGIEAAESSLKMAAQALDVQAAGFRSAATQAAESPHAAALELDTQAARIEAVSDAALQRAEFVLARQEKQRALMGEMLETLKQESQVLEIALARQQAGMENAVAAVREEAGKFEGVTGDTQRHLEMLMANAATRAATLTGNFAREAEKLKDASDTANALLANLMNGLKDAGEGARDLIAQSAGQARHDAHALVGEAMGECERLLRVAGELSVEAGKIRTTLGKSSEELERHLIRLPGLAQDEARRVRLVVQGETEQILDLSARAMSALHARGRGKGAPDAPALTGAMPPPLREAAPEEDGLKGLARRLTQRKPRKEGAAPNWEMKQLLAAVEGEEGRSLKPSNAQALAALEMALADMALDLSALAPSEPSDGEWKSYLAGDRAIFARRLAETIDAEAVDRITALYRDDERFHDAADSYLGEFEALLGKAREGDGDGLLVSTLLSADTGKVYLAMAYALGRL